MAHSVDMNPIVRQTPTGAAAPGAAAAAGAQPGGGGAGAVEGRGRHDRVELSDHARLLEKMAQTLESTPDAREAVVAAVRAQLDAGTYTVNATRLAERLVGSLPAADAGTAAAASETSA